MTFECDHGPDKYACPVCRREAEAKHPSGRRVNAQRDTFSWEAIADDVEVIPGSPFVAEYHGGCARGFCVGITPGDEIVFSDIHGGYIHYDDKDCR